MAALPPQSSDDLARGATLIVEGQVLQVDSERKFLTNGYDWHYTVRLRVSGVTKGDLKGAKELDFFCRQTGKRLQGWAGPQGQNDLPSVGNKGTFYLRWGKNGYQLLEPNGWTLVTQTKE